MNKTIRPEPMAKSINEIIAKSATLDFIENGILNAVSGDRVDLKTWTFEFLTKKTEKELLRFQKTLSGDIAESGGFLVAPFFLDMAKMAVFENEFLKRCSIFFIEHGDTLQIPVLDSYVSEPGDKEGYTFDPYTVTPQWGAGFNTTGIHEGFEKEEDDPTFKLIQLIPNELSVFTSTTQHLWDDAPSFGNFLLKILKESWVYQLQRGILRGNGAREPLGPIQDPECRWLRRTTANSICYADIVGMEEYLTPAFRKNAVWLMSQDALQSLRAKKDDQNMPIVVEHYDRSQDSNTYNDYLDSFILGHKVIVVPVDQLVALGTSGDCLLINPEWYAVCISKNFTYAASPHPGWLNNKMYVKAHGNADGMLLYGEACVRLEAALTSSSSSRSSSSSSESSSSSSESSSSESSSSSSSESSSSSSSESSSSESSSSTSSSSQSSSSSESSSSSSADA